MTVARKNKTTPLMRQYFDMKSKHQDAILLFRVGDFYETFGEDAVTASKVLGIVLTSRNNGGSDIELAGFPHHSIDSYLPKLIQNGYRVAICEQLEKPSKEKKIVKRGVTDLVTPGLGTSENLLNSRENNYLASIFIGDKSSTGCAFLDLSTGDFQVFEGHLPEVLKLVNTYTPKEILFSKKQKAEVENKTEGSFYLYGLDEWIFQADYAFEKLTSFFGVSSLKGFGLDGYGEGVIASGAILHYLESTENTHTQHITKLRRIHLEKYMWLDQFTIRNLELVHSNHPSGMPLVDVLDKTTTPMGGRLMRKWILLPLTDVKAIHQRQEIVDELFKDPILSDNLDSLLGKMSDLERIIARVALRKVNPRELHHLKKSLVMIPEIKELLNTTKNKAIERLTSQMNEIPEVIEKLDAGIHSDPPISINKGQVIAPGYDEDLDRFRDLIRNSKGILKEVLARETVRTGISNLKIGYNNVFGYYFEVTNRYKDQGLIPEDWMRKQTLTNSERYISEELKKLESEILGAEDKIQAREQYLFAEIVEWLTAYIESIQYNAAVIAEIDCMNSFAKVSLRNSYSRPEINESYSIHIENGRHPVIEATLPLGESYIPNNLNLSNDGEQILLITGPNMAGKSAILRQTALICLMAQMGCHVPASKASIGLIDRIFTRVGASDNISSGESTFMVEMIETASIMNNLSNRSLILLDEIGRGTSTYDGISIAWSIVEFLHGDPSKPKTLFATHYHELSQLADKHERIENYNVAVKEHGDRIIFLRKLVKGSTNQSFGIKVALMSGLPRKIISRADQILHLLQENTVEHHPVDKETLGKLPVQNGHGQHQLQMFPQDPVKLNILEELQLMNVQAMTPIECLLKLNELSQKLKD